MMKPLIALAPFALTATPAWAQLSGPLAGGPTGQFLGPPPGNVARWASTGTSGSASSLRPTTSTSPSTAISGWSIATSEP